MATPPGREVFSGALLSLLLFRDLPSRLLNEHQCEWAKRITHSLAVEF
jgi:hypothetical protein